MLLMFKDQFGDERFVAEVADEREANVEMMDYIHKLNPSYEVHYVRSWGEEPVIYDVGSHSEFFHLYK